MRNLSQCYCQKSTVLKFVLKTYVMARCQRKAKVASNHHCFSSPTRRSSHNSYSSCSKSILM